MNERLHKAIEQLINGWTEAIEHSILVCNRKELRVNRIHHKGLLDQLADMTAPLKEGPQNGGTSNKPGSKPPGSLEALSLLLEIRDTASTTHSQWSPRIMSAKRTTHGNLRACIGLAHQVPQSDVDTLTHSLNAYIRRALILLGHEAPTRYLANSICGTCGGALKVAIDATSDVRCAGTPETKPCGTVYAQHTWLMLLTANEGQ